MSGVQSSSVTVTHTVWFVGEAMRSTVVTAAPESQSASSDLGAVVRSANADLHTWLGLLGAAMKDTGWTPEALDKQWNTSRGYAWRLLSGEKPWSVERKLALPSDLRRRLAHLEAEANGLIVVAPAATTQDGIRHLVIGLVSVLASPLPARADRMAHAELSVPMAKAVGQ